MAPNYNEQPGVQNFSGMNYYQRLGVDPTASREDIVHAFRERAMEWHPDRNKSPNAGKQFRSIYEAYQALSDPKTRALYDNPATRKRASATASSTSSVISPLEEMLRHLDEMMAQSLQEINAGLERMRQGGRYISPDEMEKYTADFRRRIGRKG